MRQAQMTERAQMAAGAKRSGTTGRRALAAAVALSLGFGALAPLGVSASGGMFSPVVYVNNRAVTQYELDQRIRFMELLRQPGDLHQLALDTLIEDRLRLAEAARLGIKASPDMVKAGMGEFAGRVNLSVDDFLKAIGQAGVDPQTFRDFVEAGMVWREVVRQRYAPTTQVTDAEIDRAMSVFVPDAVPTLKIAEIVLPGTGKERSASLALARKLKATITDEAEFAAAARKYSQAKTAGNGGRRDWIRVTDIDEKTRPALMATQPGGISAVVQTDDTVSLYMVLDRAQDQLSAAEKQQVTDYAEFLIPEGPDATAEAARIRARVDTCDNLYDVARGLPEDRLQRITKPSGQLPKDVAGPLSLLDTGESSATVTRGPWRVFLMVCRRGVDAALMPTRDDARRQLLNQRLGSMADIYLQELRTEAIIREP